MSPVRSRSGGEPGCPVVAEDLPGDQERFYVTRDELVESTALLAAIKGTAVRVQQENVKGQDVTEEFSDLNAQLTNLEATEKELRELLTEAGHFRDSAVKPVTSPVCGKVSRILRCSSNQPGRKNTSSSV